MEALNSIGTFDFALISILFFFVAMIYSSVGHAGASGYTAVLIFFSVQPILIRPTSLILNIIVGTIGCVRFFRAGLIDVKGLVPFLIVSIPAAFYFSTLSFERQIFFLILGVLLLFAGIRLVFSWPNFESNKFKFSLILSKELSRLKVVIFICVGALIGALSGITGTGGAIFFTPFLLITGLCTQRQSSGQSVFFVLVNSIFGLFGQFKSGFSMTDSHFWIWGIAVIAGAFIGTTLGIYKLPDEKLKKILGVVLVGASIKLFSMGFKL